MSTKTKPGLFIGTDGEMRRVSIDPTRGLQDYYDLIGTDIVERVTLKAFGKSVDVWCDEEALMKSVPMNHFARRLVHYPLVGDVVVHGRSLDGIIGALETAGYEIQEEAS
jgi:hypothetical protein